MDTPSSTETLQRPRPSEIFATRPGKLTLRVTTASERHDLEVEQALVGIGTHPSNAVVLSDPSVSRTHCELDIRETGVMLRDCGSKNGTWIDDVQVNEIWLPIGGHFTVGNTTIALQGIGAIDVPVSTKGQFAGLYGTGTTMGELFARLEKIAAAELDVLIVGETGTGKELVARGLHDQSARADGPFVVVDCTTLNGRTAESILFGHCNQSLTDASRDQPGFLEQANGGTIFLDEIGELPLELQPKLLRCLEFREIRRVGESSHDFRKFNARVVTATNRHLLRMVHAGKFREDLYYRLAIARVDIPPLRDRGEGNASMLADLFIERLADERGKPLRLERDIYDLLERCRWKGNVRALYNALRVAALLVEDSTISAGDIAMPEEWEEQRETTENEIAPFIGDIKAALDMRWGPARKKFGNIYAAHLMTQNDGNRTRAAAQAGVTRNTFREMLKGVEE